MLAALAATKTRSVVRNMWTQKLPVSQHGGWVRRQELDVFVDTRCGAEETKTTLLFEIV